VRTRSWRSDLLLHPKPGTDIFWLTAITRYLLDSGLAHAKFLDQWVNGLNEYRKSLESFTMEAAARVSGVPEETLKTEAKTIVDAKASVLGAMGITQHSQGSDSSTAISNLLLVTGYYRRPGTGVDPLRGHNNSRVQRPWSHAERSAGLPVRG
jgi:formate dehydrogenase major subunit